jgi:2-succinyl-6-hydroxy-2,4-cyclohexadiene-1-carboxylate synthase
VGARRAAADGVEIAFEEHGGDGRALVLVHGFTGSRRDFAPRLPALARIGRTLALDLPGHGESGRLAGAESYTLEHLAGDLLGFLEVLGLARCDVLGHSMGGMVALRAALAEPSRVASLVLMDTAARAPDGIPLDVFARARRVAHEAGMEALLRLVRARAASDPDRPAADRRLEAEWGEAYWAEWREPNFRAMDPQAYVGLGQAIVGQAPLLGRLGEIRCPTTVLVGADDQGFRLAAEELARGIPGARLVEVPDAAHQPQLENPDAWLGAVHDHLAHVRAGDERGGPRDGRLRAPV